MGAKRLILGLAALCLLWLTGCSRGETVTRTDFALDTVVTITLYDQEDSTALNEAFEELRRLDGMLSAYDEGSEISAVNRAAGQTPVAVSAETLAVVQQGLAYGEKTGGAFDITIGPLADLWNIGENTTVPEAPAIEAARALVDYRQVTVDAENSTIYLKTPGMKLNLGAVAKGYIGQKLKDFLVERGVQHGIINLGGNVVLIGDKTDGQPFNVGVEDPDDTQSTVGVLGLSDCAAVTSGDYQRYFIGEDGRRYHHILDPRTGYPAASGLRQVTIVAQDSTEADILSTACFILGLEEGQRLLESTSASEAVFVTTEHEIYDTREAGAFRFNQENTAYRMGGQ
ncbi:MAG: FAD:protein FMN transferase [Eubacterium sp.]|nr:FAD:protein FMN transferase [Eubacterium sp.]